MLFYTTLIVYFLLFTTIIRCSSFLNISQAILNTQTVIACGLSIDIYESFNQTQVTTCPYVSIDNNIQLISINISIDDDNQLVIQSDPPIIQPPTIFIKHNRNNSLIPPIYITRNSTYYLSFSSQLTCRYSSSPQTNETICFYYLISSNFISLEYDYDEIQNDSFISIETTRINIQKVFLLIGISFIIICLILVCMICASRISFRYLSRSDDIFQSHLNNQETEKQSRDISQNNIVT
ncbi:hypothetical protein I4U23_020406 [Adineta vaga]|nr:hypothetical protein I4U23_020406 [Adineta vaga]